MLKKTLQFIWQHPINQGRQIRGILRFLNSQIKLRFNPSSQRIVWVNKVPLLIRKGLHSVTGAAYLGLTDFEEMAFFLHYLRPKDCFVDVGANVGIYSILASAGAGAKTIAFEPVPETNEYLKQNIQTAGVQSRVQIFDCALGEQPGHCLITTQNDSTNHIISNEQPGEHTTKIEVRRLDDFDFGVMDALKLDVEGFEYQVLKGGENALEHCNVILVELNGSGANYGIEDQKIVDLLDAKGFRHCCYDPLTRRLSERKNYRSATCNAIMIRDIELAQSRVVDAEPFRILGRSY